MITTQDIDQVFDAKLVDRDGDSVGSIKQVYVDQEDGSPLFATVSTGLFGTSESFVPLTDAQLEGDTVRVPYEKSHIKDAPRIDADGDLADAEQDRLFEHYGLGHKGASTTGTSGPGATPGTDRDLLGRDDSAGDDTTARDSVRTDATGTDATGVGAAGSGLGTDSDRTRDDIRRDSGRVGHDTSGPTTDDAMTRSEERLHVGTEQQATGRARLRKHVVTEQKTVTVPVTHEEVTIEREPITDANRGDALDGPNLSEEEHEVVLHADRVVTDKETVPVERVQLGTETVTDQQAVTEDVAHEEIEIDGADATDGPRHRDGDSRI